MSLAALGTGGCRPRRDMPPPAPALPATPDLVGVWSGTVESPTHHGGNLELRRDTQGRWSATLDGRVETIRVSDATVSVEIAGARFRGTVGKGNVDGLWVQDPMGTTDQARATPLQLAEVKPGVFRGTVTGLKDVEPLFLVVSRRVDSTLEAFVRAPESNLGVRYGTRDVKQTGARIAFVGRVPQAAPMSAVVSDPDRLTLRLGTLSVNLTRTAPGSPRLARFWLRSPTAPRYRYRVPIDAGDGWAVKHAADAGVKAADLETLVDNLAASPCAERLNGLCPHSVLIAKDGALILDEYFAGHTHDTPHDTRSAGKSLATTLIGMAIDRGKLAASDSMVDALKGYAPIRHADDSKRAITVAHLMSMSSGLACDDSDRASPGYEDLLASRSTDDFARYIVDLPKRYAPGARAVYCSASIHLLAAIIEAATGAWSPDLVQRWFAAPLDITRYHLNLSPIGRAYFGGGIYLRPRDMAKLGQIFVSDGTWRGRRVLSRDWTRAATSAHARINDAHTDDYGYGWWIKTYTVGARRLRATYASGNGGQLIFVFPEIGTVITFTAGNYGNFFAWRAFIQDIVPNQILPALLANTP